MARRSKFRMVVLIGVIVSVTVSYTHLDVYKRQAYPELEPVYMGFSLE